MRGASITSAACLALLMLQGCSLRLQGAPSEREFRHSVTAHPYVADSTRADTIVSGAKQLKICSRRSDVRRLMGEPDFGVQTSDSNGNDIAARWTYLLGESSGYQGSRRAVDVTLNAGGYVISIISFGVPEVPMSVVIDGPGCQTA